MRTPLFTYTRCTRSYLVGDYPRQCVKPHAHDGWHTDGATVTWETEERVARYRRLSRDEAKEWEKVLGLLTTGNTSQMSLIPGGS